MSNIISFQTASERRVSSPVVSPEIFPETARQRASSKRNPLRRLYSQAATAVTIAGKLHRGEVLRIDSCFDERVWLRRGAEAARLLADELARLVEQMESGSCEIVQFSGAAEKPEHDRLVSTLPMADQQMIRAMVDENVRDGLDEGETRP